jgi:molecular chaperone DnaK
LADAKKALEGTDPAIMNSARDRLTQASHKLAEAMYKAAQPHGDAAGAPAGGTADGGAEKKKDEGVIDAEYVDVDEKKN